MAFIDAETGNCIVRIVFDGPPMTGKTESIRALSEHLHGSAKGDQVYTPSQAEERTLYFDWLDYVGGRYKGNKIHCQLVTVPGQAVLRERRKTILGTADAVLFVSDSQADNMQQSIDYLNQLREFTHRPGSPIRGIVVMANKQDLPKALSGRQVLESLGDHADMAVVETCATQATGIREAFVLAVRLAVERMQQIDRESGLETRTEPDSPELLLNEIELHEESENSASPANQPQSQRNKPPDRPTEHSPCRQFWPPDKGEKIFAGIHHCLTISQHRDDLKGLQIHLSKRWRLLTPYGLDLEQDGEGIFRRMVETYENAQPWIGTERALILIDDRNEQQVWQLTRNGISLDDLMRRILQSDDIHRFAEGLITAAMTAAAAEFDFNSLWRMPDSDEINHLNQYTGFLSWNSIADTIAKPSKRALVRHYLKPYLDDYLTAPPFPVPQILKTLDQKKTPENAEQIDVLLAMLIGH